MLEAQARARNELGAKVRLDVPAAPRHLHVGDPGVLGSRGPISPPSPAARATLADGVDGVIDDPSTGADDAELRHAPARTTSIKPAATRIGGQSGS